MQKLINAYFPFIIYSFCTAIAYFIAFFLFPKYNEPLAYLGFLIIYIYIYLGVFIIGFIIGRLTVKRLGIPNLKIYLMLAVISYFIMLFIGSLKDIFTYLYRDFTINIPFLIDAISDIDTRIISIGTFVTFLIGEIIENYKLKNTNNYID